MKELIEISEELLKSNTQKDIDEKLWDDFLKIFEAKYAVFNLFYEDKQSIFSKPVAGLEEIVKKVTNILENEAKKMKIKYDIKSEHDDKTSYGNEVIHFNSFKELAQEKLPASVVSSVEKNFGDGEVILIGIAKDNMILGSVTLFIEKYKRFDKFTLAKGYSKQLGMLITHKRAEEALMKEKILTDAIFYSIPGMIYLYDDQRKLVRWNKKHEDITGYSSEELSKMSLMDWYKGDERSQRAVKEGVMRAIEQGFGDAEAELQKKDGTTIPMYFTASTFYLEKKQYFVGVGIDITEQKKRETRIFNLSYHDQLTGLYNRRFYEEELKRLDVEENLPLTIVMGDVNGLKLINDSFGHIMGDMLIKKVSQIITAGCRAYDIAARLGGDEFVIILQKTDSFEAEQIIKRISDLAANEKVGSVDISISFGYGTKATIEEKIEDTFKNAEDRMYAKKLFESQSMRGKTIKAILSTLHEKNKKEEQHSYRVSKLCKKVGEALGFSEYENEELRSVGLLHDIGKIAIDETILNNTDGLTEEEDREFKRHSEIGYRILNTVNDMSKIASDVLYHHENWDGTGYPKGLKGNEIPLVSRIIAIADAYDKMTREKKYPDALIKKIAIEELQKKAGSMFDPELIRVFVEKVLLKSDEL